MSSRTYRKILQEKGLGKESETLENTEDVVDNEQDDESDDADEQQTSQPQVKKNLFDLLDEEEEDEDEDESQNKKSGGGKKKKKKSKSKQQQQNQPPQPQPQPKQNQPQKKKKKGKAQDDDEDIEKVISEINEKFGSAELKSNQQKSFNESANQTSVTSVDSRMLDAENELAKFFGSKLVKSESNRRQVSKLKKTFLATPKDTWPIFDRTGLSMEVVETVNGITTFKFVHSQSYQKVQNLFWQCVDSYDPANLAQLLNMHPYHIDCLLALSEVCKHSGDVGMGGDLVERALYIMEKCFHPLFNPYAGGICRLSFKQWENRAFFLAIFRHIQYLSRRGCWRTALEFCKLLYSLDPENDPYCSLLMIDFYALRSGQYEYLEKFYESENKKKKLHLLPNWSFSLSLAQYHLEIQRKESHETSTKNFIDSCLRYPGIVGPLCEQAGVTTSKIHPSFHMSLPSNKSEEGLKTLALLYVDRSISVWKEADVLEWWKGLIPQVTTKISEEKSLFDKYDQIRKSQYSGTPLNVYRHVFVTDSNKVTATLPHDVVNGPIHMHDPIPPANSVAGYERTSANTQRNRFENMSTLGALVDSILPWSTENGAPGIQAMDPREIINYIRNEIARRQQEVNEDQIDVDDLDENQNQNQNQNQNF